MNNSLAEEYAELVSEWSKKNLPLKPNNRIDGEHIICFGKYALFILYTFMMEFGFLLDFQVKNEYNKRQWGLLGFIAELTSFTSKHTSFECRIAVKASEKVVFQPFQMALMPVRTT